MEIVENHLNVNITKTGVSLNVTENVQLYQTPILVCEQEDYIEGTDD